MDILFDIVVPVGPNDSTIIKNMLTYTKKNIIGYRNIYLVSFDSTLNIPGCITINENVFPFDKEYLSTYLGNNNRLGWYLQQLIKLYAGFYIEGILDNYLVVDSDTFFLKPTSFFSSKLPLYNVGTEYHLPYFNHMNKLHPSLAKKSNYSGICHHMMFQKTYVNELFNLIETYHNDKFYNIFLKSIDKNDILHSGASEYEMYFNFMLTYHNKDIIIRPLQWANVNSFNVDYNLDYISYHWYMR
jgi:hypothetical protein